MLAPVEGVVRGRGVAAAARAAPGQVAGSGPAGPVGGDRGLLSPAGAQRGIHTGPSPVDGDRLGSKHHLITDAAGIPLKVTLTGGHRNDVTQLIPLVDGLPPIRGRVGRPLRRTQRLYADCGYDHDKYRRRITPHIARRGTPHGSGLGIHRWYVERTISSLPACKRLR